LWGGVRQSSKSKLHIARKLSKHSLNAPARTHHLARASALLPATRGRTHAPPPTLSP
jgi:hypothetical protein